MGSEFFTSGRIDRQKVWLWKRHWERIKYSRDFFGWKNPISESEILDLLRKKSDEFTSKSLRFRINFTESSNQIQINELPNSKILNAELVVGDSSDLYKKGIKSTKRECYKFVPKSSDSHVFLIHNREGKISEFDIGNVVFWDGDSFFTPKKDLGFSGIGLGLFSEFLNKKGKELNYDSIKISDIPRYKSIFLINAVRGLVPVHINGILENVHSEFPSEVNEFFFHHQSSVSL